MRKTTLSLLFTFTFTFSFKFLQTLLIIKQLTMKTNSIGKFFTIEKVLKIDIQNFHISWKASKNMSGTFLGRLHNETIVKYVFHEMLWKKYLTVYAQLKAMWLKRRKKGEDRNTKIWIFWKWKELFRWNKHFL